MRGGDEDEAGGPEDPGPVDPGPPSSDSSDGGYGPPDGVEMGLRDSSFDDDLDDLDDFGDLDALGDLDDADHVTGRSGGRVPVHPDDRLWRHPSEVASAGLPAASNDARPWPRHRPRPRPTRPVGPGQRLVAVGLSGVVGALLTAGLLAANGNLSRVEVAAPQPTSTSRALDIRSSAAYGAAALVAKVQPGVLSVQSTRVGVPTTWGSALVVRPGHAITALHVVDGASSIVVGASDGLRTARVVGSDADTDLALLALEGPPIEPPSVGSSSALRPGDMAVGVAAPATSAIGPSVTVGVVSALDRTMILGTSVLRGVMVLDRPVPAEGAGGALVDASGDVVGITLPASDPSIQVGYAIPMDSVNDVSRQLLASGRVSRPWLGIEGGDTSESTGANVRQVRPASPAARAGVQVGDVVTALDSAPIRSMDDMLRLLRAHTPGDTVKLTVSRKGKPADLLVTLAER